jgi:hypothetical protein
MSPESLPGSLRVLEGVWPVALSGGASGRHPGLEDVDFGQDVEEGSPGARRLLENLVQAPGPGPAPCV